MSVEATSGRLRGRWLKFTRVIWVAVAALTLGLDAAGFPYAYEKYKIACTGDSCFGPLTPETLRALHEMGLSADFFAGYVVVVQITVMLVFAGVSAVIFWRGPNDVMALYTSFTLLIFGGAAFTNEVPGALTEAHPGFSFPLAVLYYVGQVTFFVFFYIFPDGRFRPRWTLWVAVVVALLWVPSTFFPGSPLDVLGGPFFIFVITTTVVAQVYRYRRVSGPTQRQKTKWVVFGVVVAIVGFSVTISALQLFPVLDAANPLAKMSIFALVQGSITLVPLSMGVAILRSRLYDIDVVINRTLVYGALSVTLAIVYFGSIALLQAALIAITGQKSQLAVVASTLLIAALFNPIRRRTQNLVDRRFYRGKYDGEQVLAAFSDKLRDETDLDRLSEDLLVVVRETVQPEHTSLWLRTRDRGGRGE